MNTLLYVGAGGDIRPLLHFKECANFIFVDTQPRSGFDSSNSFNDGFYNTGFVSNIIIDYAHIGFTVDTIVLLDEQYYKKILNTTPQQLINYMECPIEYINPTLFVFINHVTKQTIKYYVSTNILYNMNDELSTDLKKANGLIISGYYPDKQLLTHISCPIHFFGYTETYYGVITAENFDESELNTIMNVLDMHVLEHDNVMSYQPYFDKFYSVNRDTGEFVEKTCYIDLFTTSLAVK